MKKLSESFAAQLSLRFMFILTVAVIILSVSFLSTVRMLVNGQQSAELKNAAETIFHTLSTDNDKPVSDIPYYLTYIVYETETKQILSTNDPFLPLLPDSAKKAQHYFEKDFFFDGDLNLLYYAEPYHLGIEGFENVIIAAAMNLDNNTAAMIFTKLPPAILLMGLPILIASFFLSFFITRNTIKPVVKITRTAQSMTIENLGEMLPVSKNNDEIDELSKTFNELFKRIKADFERERQFSSDVSHELNTPLTVIKGQTNLLLRWGKDNPEQLEKSLNAIKDETNSMQSIIENLLQISRIESGRIKPVIAGVNLGQLFERIKDEFNAIYPKVKFVIHGEITINTDGEMLHQILTALVANSIKFSDADCTITLKAEGNADSYIIEESDNGLGIREDALPHIFERFFRADEAHTRSTGGAGLGLAIVHSLSQVLNIRIKAQTIQPHGAQFRLIH